MSRRIEDKQILDRFNKLYSEFKRVPTQEEMGYRQPIKRIYGNYNNFLRELGHMPNFRRTKEDYIQYIKALSKELKKTPSLNDLEERGIYRLPIYELFGNYNQLLRESGFETREMTYTDKIEEELLTDYIELCNKLGRWATTRELESVDIYENRFGSIIEVRKLVLNDERLKIDDKMIVEARQKYTDKEIKQFAKDAINKYGFKITKAEFANYLKEIKGPSINTIMKRNKTTSFKKLIEMCKD